MKHLPSLVIAAILILFLFGLVSCVQDSIEWTPADSNTPYILKGKPAVEMGEALAKNTLDKEGRMNELQKYNAWLYAGLVVTFVAGFIFWGYTHSRYGFVLPVASVAGIGLISFWAAYAEWIAMAVAVLALALLVWKAIEYHKERNENKFDREISTLNNKGRK